MLTLLQMARRARVGPSRPGAVDSQLVEEPAMPTRIAPVRGPPMWEASDDGLADAVPDWDALAQPEPEYVFDQQAQW